MAPTLKQMVYRYVREKLAHGALSPGAKLSDLALSREIGVSRTPVREVINQLASEGLVELIPHVGAFVRCPDPREIEELYELREVLESHAAGKVARERAASTTEALVRTQGEMAELSERLKRSGAHALSEKETARQRELDLAFHTGILSAAGNARLVRVVEDGRILGRVFDLMEAKMDAKTLATTCRMHGKILAAIKSRSESSARERMAEHIRLGKIGMLKRVDAWQSAPGARDRVPEALRRFAQAN